MGVHKMVCNVDEDLLAQVDAYAAQLHISRTSAVSVLLSQALQAKQTITTLDELLRFYQAQEERKNKEE